MQLPLISSLVSAPLKLLAGLGGGNEPAEAQDATAADEAVKADSTIRSTTREVLARYNIHQITPRQYSQLVEELRGTGEVPSEDLQALSALRLGLDHDENIESDEPMDMLQWVRQKLASLSQQAADPTAVAAPGEAPLAMQLAQTQKQSSWLERIARLQSGSVNTVV